MIRNAMGVGECMYSYFTAKAKVTKVYSSMLSALWGNVEGNVQSFKSVRSKSNDIGVMRWGRVMFRVTKVYGPTLLARGVKYKQDMGSHFRS